MKRCLLLVITILYVLLLASCSTYLYETTDRTKETWQYAVKTNPYRWKFGSDPWFASGLPNEIEILNRHASYDIAMSTTTVRVPNFSNLIIDGNFQVELYGTDEHNSVHIYGPNPGVRAIGVEIQGNTLAIRQTLAEKAVEKVIIRIGVCQLHSLTKMGKGRIEGVQLQSHDLIIITTPESCGSIYLSGNIQLRHIHHEGVANMTLFGINTPDLSIDSKGSGRINISGRVGIRSIKHSGESTINIVGARSRCLDIEASGCGKISIHGEVNLRNLHAEDNVLVLIYFVNSQSVHANATNHAMIGLAGNTKELHLTTSKNACFQGRYLRAQNAFVKSYQHTHINVNACNELFAYAAGASTIYFFGSPERLTRFVNGNGTIIPVGSDPPILPRGFVPSRSYAFYTFPRTTVFPVPA